MRKVVLAVLCIMISVVFVGVSFAVPPGKTLDWDNPGGKVIFDGKSHAEKGFKCNDCHTSIFKMKKGSAEMKMADINSGKFCGVCHDGSKAFKASDSANCVKCHKK